MRIAVTGAAGYIGGHLAAGLRDRDHEVWTQDYHATRHHYQGSTFDLADDNRRREWLQDSNPDVVVHLAAKYGRVWGEAGLKETAYLNAGMTAELARDCNAYGMRLVYVSSSEVYGEAAMKGLPVPEFPAYSALRPLNMYGLTKKWGEEACQLYAPEGLAIARLNMPYGPPAALPEKGSIPHHSGRVGPRGYNALHTMAWQAVHGMPITVHRGTDRCYTWVSDAILALALIIESGFSGTWNVCRDDDHVSAAELARRCVELAGSRSGITEREPDPGITPRKHLESARLRQDLGWRPAVSLDEGIPRVLEYVSRFDQDGRWLG